MVTVLRSVRFTLVFALILGILYPLFVTLIGQTIFPYQANGSLVTWQGKPIGSMLIAQANTSPGLFSPRPSAVDYAANNSGATNYGPTNPALFKEVKANLLAVQKANPGIPIAAIPMDMVESSASGLDPDISIANATIQTVRIARVTHIKRSDLLRLIAQQEHHSFLGLWGSDYVNVLRLNLALLKKEAMRHHG